MRTYANNANRDAGKSVPYKKSQQSFTLFMRGARRLHYMKGFTIFEVLVMLAIVTAISAQVLFSFTGLNEGAALHRSAQQLALAIRRAQNMSLAVSTLRVGQTFPQFLIPPAVGVRISTATRERDRYVLFADLGNPGNRAYDADTEFIAEEALHRGVRVQELRRDGAAVQEARIVFAAPEAEMEIATDPSPVGQPPQRIDIVLKANSGQTRTITVTTSGQVSIQ